jgi:type II secretory pathway pseudopilin PulG
MTLLELLLALTIVVGISALLLSTTQIGLQSLHRAERLDDDAAPAALRLQLRRWVQNATPPTLLTPLDKKLEGDRNQLRFITLEPAGYAINSAALEIYIEKQNTTLVMRVSQLNDAGEELSKISRTLSDTAETLEFSYLTKDDNDQFFWTPDWMNESSLPLAFRIADPQSRQQNWPDFIAALLHAEP